MGEGELFGEVRAVVHGASTYVAWSDLCLLLEGSDPESYGSRLAPYLLDTLSSWPDEVRVAPVRWLAAACRGEPTPWLGLARHLYISQEVLRACAPASEEPGAAPRGAARLVELQVLRDVSVLEVAGEWNDRVSYEALCEAEIFERVRRARIGYSSKNYRQPHVFDYGLFEGSSLARGLEGLALDLSGRSGQPMSEWLLGLAGGGFESLTSLALEGESRDDTRLLEHALNARGLSGLEAFSWKGVTPLERALDLDASSAPNLKALEIGFRRIRKNHGGFPEADPYVLESVEALDPSRLTSLSLRGVALDEGRCARLLDALGPEGGLEELRLVSCYLGADEATELGAFGGFGALRALDLSENEGLGPRGGRELLDVLDAPNLEALSLRDAGLGEKWLDGLARLRGLRELDLSGKNAIRAAGGEVVSMLPALEFAVLERAGLNAGGLAALGGGEAAGSLRYLDVRANRLGVEGVEALVGSGLRPEVLYLGRDQVSNDLDAECMRMLAGWEGMESVRTLSVCNSKLKQKDLMILLRSERLRGLEFLDISSNSLGKAGAIALSECDHLSGLRGLGLASCGLRRPGLEAFGGITFFERLAFLSISGNGLDPAEFEEIWLDAASNFPALEWFDGGWCSDDSAERGALDYARIQFYSKQTSSRWIAPWMLPTSAAQPTYLDRWERG